MNRKIYILAIILGICSGFYIFCNYEDNNLKSKVNNYNSEMDAYIDSLEKIAQNQKPPIIYEKLYTPTQNDSFLCLISSSRKIYTQGKPITIETKILNKSGNDIFLIRNIDGSDFGIRYPYCQFSIIKVDEPSEKFLFRGCGNTDNIYLTDFSAVKNNQYFYPFEREKSYSYFGEIVGNQIQLKSEYFEKKGEYKIQFLYSTESKSLKNYAGYGNEFFQDSIMVDSINTYLKKVPKIKLYSNILKIQIK